MINDRGQIMNSIPSTCKDYAPIKNKPTSVSCSKLGKLFECSNHEGEKAGCIFCERFKNSRK